jgi:hypothetical protein
MHSLNRSLGDVPVTCLNPSTPLLQARVGGVLFSEQFGWVVKIETRAHASHDASTNIVVIFGPPGTQCRGMQLQQRVAFLKRCMQMPLERSKRDVLCREGNAAKEMTPLRPSSMQSTNASQKSMYSPSLPHFFQTLYACVLISSYSALKYSTLSDFLCGSVCRRKHCRRSLSWPISTETKELSMVLFRVTTS